MMMMMIVVVFAVGVIVIRMPLAWRFVSLQPNQLDV